MLKSTVRKGTMRLGNVRKAAEELMTEDIAQKPETGVGRTSPFSISILFTLRTKRQKQVNKLTEDGVSPP